MIQSRGQFGAYGAIVVVVVVIIMYLGFIASNLVLAGDSINNLVSGISVDLGIVICTLIGIGICTYGHDMIHLVNRVATVLCAAILVLAVVALFVRGAPHGTLSAGGWSLSGFVATVAVAVLWQIAYAPYVSDYSRYLPVDTPVRETFLALPARPVDRDQPGRLLPGQARPLRRPVVLCSRRRPVWAVQRPGLRGVRDRGRGRGPVHLDRDVHRSDRQAAVRRRPLVAGRAGGRLPAVLLGCATVPRWPERRRDANPGRSVRSVGRHQRMTSSSPPHARHLSPPTANG
jgi:hypothetical protein